MSKLFEGVLMGAAVAAVAGCLDLPSVGPDYREPSFEVTRRTLPDAGMPTTNLTRTCEYEPAVSNDDVRVVISDDTLAQWWRRFDDPILENLVVGAVSNNVSYRIAARKLEEAKWNLFGSYAAFLPKFDIGGGWNRNWYHENTSSGGGSRKHGNVQQLGLNGDWEIDLFGGNRRRAEAALAQAEAADWEAADAWVSLTTQIGSRYVELRTVQDSISVARTNLVLQSEIFDILRSRLDSGIGDELAVNQSAYIVEQTRASIPGLLAREEALKNEIAILAGEMPGSLAETLAPVNGARDWLLAPQKVNDIPLDWIRARPDVKRAERLLAAATASIGVAKALWFPKLVISGSVGLNNVTKHNLFSKESFIAGIGPSVSWPIFQGGAIYANVKAAESRMEQAALAYELAIENAYAEVRNAYAAYTQEYHRYRSLQGAVKAATDAVTISKDLYKNGLKDFNNVLDAQRSRLQFEGNLVESRGKITENLIQLYRALGGGLANGEMRADRADDVGHDITIADLIED